MEHTKTILVPIDFQEASTQALAKARELGKQLDLAVVLVHTFSIPVVVYPGFDPILTPGLSDEIANAAKKALERLAEANGGLQTMLRSGDAATEILAAAEELRPTMVVMGTHGRKGLSHLLLGSVAETVIRSSKVPVLTVRAPGS
ncbi:MAG: universal stress protein [Minicystis sp.]